MFSPKHPRLGTRFPYDPTQKYSQQTSLETSNLSLQNDLLIKTVSVGRCNLYATDSKSKKQLRPFRVKVTGKNAYSSGKERMC